MRSDVSHFDSFERLPPGASSRGSALGSRRSSLVWLLWFVLLGGAFFAPSGVLAKRRFKYKVAKFVESKGTIYMNVSFRELFTKKLRKKLRSGFVQTVLVRLTLKDAITGRKITRTVWTCTVIYDLWESRYSVRVADSQKKKKYEVKSLKEAVEKSTSIKRLPLVEKKKVAPMRYYYVNMKVLYNPMSKSLLRKVKKWLTSPRGGGPTRLVRGSSFFGSSLSFFVNPRISPAERLLNLRSQNFYRTEK